MNTIGDYISKQKSKEKEFYYFVQEKPDKGIKLGIVLRKCSFAEAKHLKCSKNPDSSSKFPIPIVEK